MTDLPVLLPAADRLLAMGRTGVGAAAIRLRLWHGVALGAVVLLSAALARAAPGSAPRPGVLQELIRWTPLLLRGFGFNLLISFLSMAIGTGLGAVLGLLLISLHPSVRWASWVVTQFFRNAPWLVLIFFATFLLPFQLRLGGATIPLPDWVKAVIGLSLPVMANVAEIVRGAVASIPSGQWEAAESLAFSRRQQVWSIILPQCIKRMLPPWMNLYAILTMATVLASIVGVNEVMTIAGQVEAAEGGRTDLLTPLYGYILIWFFLYSYPIARLTQRLERRYAVNI
ncbi:MAG: amino acid ABC transporter permease [Pseudomonadota bacterium]|nr:amino acid ABC transporter permease [Pseudomonadota bacterium]